MSDKCSGSFEVLESLSSPLQCTGAAQDSTEVGPGYTEVAPGYNFYDFPVLDVATPTATMSAICSEGPFSYSNLINWGMYN